MFDWIASSLPSLVKVIPVGCLMRSEPANLVIVRVGSEETGRSSAGEKDEIPNHPTKDRIRRTV